MGAGQLDSQVRLGLIGPQFDFLQAGDVVSLLFLDGAGDFDVSEGAGLSHLVRLALLDQGNVAFDACLALADIEQVDIVAGRRK